MAVRLMGSADVAVPWILAGLALNAHVGNRMIDSK